MKRIDFLRVMRGRRGLALIGLTLALIGLTLWGFDRLYGPRLTEAQVIALARWRNSEWSQRASLAELQEEGERYAFLFMSGSSVDAFYDGRRQWWVIYYQTMSLPLARNGEWTHEFAQATGPVYEWTVDERTRRVVPRNAQAKLDFSRQPTRERAYATATP